MDEDNITMPTGEPSFAPIVMLTGPVLVDYVGDGDRPARQMAPLVAAIGQNAPLVLQPGLNCVDADVWGVYAQDHDAVVSLVSGGQVRVMDRPPRKLGPLDDLISRTFCLHGLGAIEAAERDYYGDKPRRVVMELLAQQRARVGKCRSKRA